MRLERIGPGGFRITLHAYELATLVAAARWAAEAGKGDLDPEARAQLATVLESYENEQRRLNERRSPDPLSGSG
jgi:hypothetical protein